MDRHQFLSTALLTLAIALPVHAGTYDVQAQKAIQWIEQQQRPDGSWGSADSVRYTHTSEAVLALAALNRRSPQYYAGMTWLLNHAPASVDQTARRILATQMNGNSVAGDLQSLQNAQNGGWGVLRTYQSAALDTALVLQAYNQAGVTANVASAVTYLTGAQLTGGDKGWAIGQESTSDPLTTAQVLAALIPLKANYASLPTAISNGVAALNAKVTTTSPISHQAWSAIANLRNNPTSPQASPLLSNIATRQGADGSWNGNDIYATALAMRALAAGMSRDLAAEKQTVNMPDEALRAAVNQALGRNALDALTVGELHLLTTLSANGVGVTDLTGLQYASNLTYLDLRNNNVTDFNPVSGLASATILKDGNPVAGGGDADVPTLPEWGAMLLGAVLLWLSQRKAIQPPRLG